MTAADSASGAEVNADIHYVSAATRMKPTAALENIP
jgi:hypothetical protein